MAGLFKKTIHLIERIAALVSSIVFALIKAARDGQLELKPGYLSKHSKVVLPTQKDAFGWCQMTDVYLVGRSHMVGKNEQIFFYDLDYWFDRSRYLPEYWIASRKIDECFGIIMMDTRIHYHNLKDILFQFYLMRLQNKKWPVVMSGSLSSVNRELLKAIQFDNEIIEMPKKLFAAHIQKFHTLDFTETNILGKNSDKIRPYFKDYAMQIASHFAGKPDSSGRHSGQRIKLFSTRRTSERRPQNINEVEDLFRSYNYQVVEFGSLSLREQISLVKNSQIIAGPHGANLVNLIFAETGTRVFELMPSNFQVDCYERLSEIFELPYSKMIAGEIQGIDFAVDLLKLKSQLDEIERDLKNS